MKRVLLLYGLILDFNRYTNSTISSTILENKENVEWENESEAIADERHTTLEMENEPSNKYLHSYVNLY